MSIRLKKTLSAVFAVMIAFVIVISVFPPVQASALAMIKYKITYTEKAAKLTFTPISSSNTIYYTAGGAKPTTSSKVYTKTLSTKKSVVIRAAEYDKNGKKVGSIKLTLAPRVITPKVSVNEDIITVTSGTAGAKIYYTTDGTIPSKSSKLYNDPLKALPGTIFRFRAFKSGLISSKASAVYCDEEKASYNFQVTDDQLMVLNLANRVRAAQADLGSLKLDETLCKAAAVRAKEISKKFDHERPDGTKYSALLEQYGITNIYSAENIAEGYVDPYDVMEGWVNSERHLKNLLGPNYDHIGIVVYTSDGIIYWVQIFGGLGR